jgi:pimeloyl-ACP methyl ester carboxylesterase
MFVKQARLLADKGIMAVRFDCRGRGISDGAFHDASIETMTQDAVCAVQFAGSLSGVNEVILLGICSGAKVAISAAIQTSVSHLVLWSAEALGDLRSANTNKHKTVRMVKEYALKMTRLSTWRRLFKGEVDVAGVQRAVFQHETRTEEEAKQENRLLKKFRQFNGQLLFIYGGNDPETGLAGEGYRRFCQAFSIPHEYHVVEEANHSFYSLKWEADLLQKTSAWMGT